MAITHVQRVAVAEDNDSDATLTFTLTATPTPGNLLVAPFYHEDTTTQVSLSDSRGHTWNLSPIEAVNGPNVTAGIAWIEAPASNPLQSGDTVTLTFAGVARPKGGAIEEFTGATIWTVNQAAANPTTGQPFGNTNDTGTTPATTVADTLAVALFAPTGTNTVATPPAGFTALSTFGGSFGGGNGTQIGRPYYRVNSTTGAQTAQIVYTGGSNYYANVIVAFTGTPAGGGTENKAGSDAGALAESSQITSQTAGAEGTLSEDAAASSAVTAGTETGGLTEGATVSTGTAKTGTDTGTLADTASVTVGIADDDTGTVTDAGTLGAPPIDLPRIDLPTFVMLDPRLTATVIDPHRTTAVAIDPRNTAAAIDPRLTAATLDPQTTEVVLDG